ALDYRLMSQYTSFVAVDAKDAEKLDKERPAQPPRRMLVPVPLPEGTQWEGFFGPLDEILVLAGEPMLKKAKARLANGLARRKANVAASAPWDGAMPGLGMGGLGGGGMA